MHKLLHKWPRILLGNMYSLLTVGIALAISSTASADIIEGEELVDPTRPLMFATSPAAAADLGSLFRNIVPANFDISFIRASSDNPIAVINNLQVTVGDVIGGAIVSSIGRDSVTLIINDEEQIINLYKTSVKSAVISR
ncbi:MAG: hypothetical protein ACI95C_002806 [Pseudohongiellaceae bacterium]